jgi:hypothetical protein
VGSSPIVSTAKVLVRAVGLTRSRCVRNVVPTYAPTRIGLWRLIGGTAGHERFLAEALEVPDVLWLTRGPQPKMPGSCPLAIGALLVPLPGVIRRIGVKECSSRRV